MFIQKLNKISFVFFIVLFFSFFISRPVKAIPCEVGTFSSDGQQPCAPCEAGTFQADEGAMACNDCPPGRYQDQTGQSECVLCDPGTYQDQPGQIECSECVPGTFQSEEGSSSCQNCDVGTFTSEIESSSCDNCPAGTYQDEQGQAECTQCDENTFSSAEASTSCQECTEGSYSDLGAEECNSVCGDSITFSDEDCDDGNAETLDGCAVNCTYETNNQLEETNSSVNFSTLATNEPLTIQSPNFASSSNCTCSWSVNPSSVGSVSGGSSCRQFLTPTTLGEANLAVEEDCASTSSTTFNQTLVITSEGTAPSGSCSFLLRND